MEDAEPDMLAQTCPCWRHRKKVESREKRRYFFALRRYFIFRPTGKQNLPFARYCRHSQTCCSGERGLPFLSGRSKSGRRISTRVRRVGLANRKFCRNSTSLNSMIGFFLSQRTLVTWMGTSSSNCSWTKKSMIVSMSIQQ